MMLSLGLLQKMPRHSKTHPEKAHVSSISVFRTSNCSLSEDQRLLSRRGRVSGSVVIYICTKRAERLSSNSQMDKRNREMMCKKTVKLSASSLMG